MPVYTEPLSKNVGTRVSASIYTALAEYASKNNMTQSEALRKILEAQLMPDLIMQELRMYLQPGLYESISDTDDRVAKAEGNLMGLSMYLTAARAARERIVEYLEKIDAYNYRVADAVDLMMVKIKETATPKKEAPDIDKTEPSQT